MGLDINLSGRITPGIAPVGEYSVPKLLDGFEIEEVRVKLGFWRKDWFLQNFIMERYPDEGDGYEWSFTAECLRKILGDIQSGALNDTSVTKEDGDYPKDMFENTVSTFQRAIEWVESAPDNEWRDVIYRAFW